jgi:hypothetical protein
MTMKIKIAKLQIPIGIHPWALFIATEVEDDPPLEMDVMMNIRSNTPGKLKVFPKINCCQNVCHYFIIKLHILLEFL